MNKIKIAPSILSADFSNLATDIEKVEKAGADILHIDVMDGHFVNNITFGPALIKSIRNKSSLPFDVHLMINPADKYIDDFIAAGADTITVHIELQENISNTINQIKSKGKRAGLAINPDTAINKILPYKEIIDQVIIMSVYPGFAGQSFIEATYDRIKTLRSILNNSRVDIEVDGGVNAENSNGCVQAGCNILVAGSSVFNSSDYKKNIDDIRKNM
ncbi:MAG: ribulose-phosphate 3-epimerase [Hyphomicrobiales bacterium]|jgi:ribulose-phosphate 3-epimerase